MAHPNVIPRALGPDALEQRAVIDYLDLGATKLPTCARPHLAAELSHHRVLAIADAKHRQTRSEDGIWSRRRVAFIHAGGAAGEDDRFGLKPLEPFFGSVVGDDLAVHAGLAHAPRNELCKLGAEIENEDSVFHDERLRQSLEDCNSRQGATNRRLLDSQPA